MLRTEDIFNLNIEKNNNFYLIYGLIENLQKIMFQIYLFIPCTRTYISIENLSMRISYLFSNFM